MLLRELSGLVAERAARGKYAIEHVMPRKWETHWPLPVDGSDGGDRNRLVHTLGNLTLLTGKLNSKVSNGPWLGTNGKRELVWANDVLMLNKQLYDQSAQGWTEGQIRQRSLALAEVILQVWPAPAGHKTDFGAERRAPRKTLTMLDLLNAGVLQVGMRLHPRIKKFEDRTAILLADGAVEVEGTRFAGVSDAAVAIRGKQGQVSNGWWFFLVDLETRRSLRKVRLDYLESMAIDVDDDESDDDGEDDEP